MALSQNELKNGIDTFIKLLSDENPNIQQQAINQVRDALNESNGGKVKDLKQQLKTLDIELK